MRTTPTRLVLLCAFALSLLVSSAASAAPYLPPSGKVFHGVAAGNSISDFAQRSGKHPAAWGHFIRWGGNMEYTFRNSESSRTRMLLALSTASGQNLPGVISPGEIARGKGDRYLVSLNRRLAQHGQPVYMRLMGEMNNCDNAYSPIYCNGRSRGSDNTAVVFKKSWKRMVVILRGGDVQSINTRLRRMGLPPLQHGADSLPTPKVAFVWSPMTGGSPMISSLAPGRFWPGARYVDWVGTSFYSRYPNFRWLTPYYNNFAGRYKKPFMLAEWAVWGGDHASFVKQLYGWVATHKRTRAMFYNQGNLTNGPFRLRNFPGAAAAVRRGAASSRYAAWAPEYR